MPRKTNLDLLPEESPSVDRHNGIVVFNTGEEVPAGSVLTIAVGETFRSARVEAGQAWFYLGREIESDELVRATKLVKPHVRNA